MNLKLIVVSQQKFTFWKMDASSLVMLSWSVTHLIFVQINVASALVKFSTEIVIKSVEELSSVITNAKTLVIKTARHVIDLAPKNALTRFVPESVVRFVSNV